MPEPRHYLRNAWYMAAWGIELGEQLLRRQLLGEPMLLFRKSDGTVAALVDRCPHRFAPLSMGVRDGDRITCPYHGLTFDPDGSCVRNPFSETLPKGARVRTFPTKESDGVVWFWPGETELAAVTPVPDFAMLTVSGHGPPITGHMPLHAPYEFGTDNLMDLSHIEFVHKGSFAGRGVIFAGTHAVKEDGVMLRSDWWMPDVAAPPHTFGIYDPQSRCDHWLEMRWEPPASMYLQIGACHRGEDRQEGVIAHQAHILTPETATSTHYFWATTRTSPPTQAGDRMLEALMSAAFADEDKPIIEAAYANLQGADFWDMQPVYLGIDGGGTRARRMLQKLIALEGSQS